MTQLVTNRSLFRIEFPLYRCARPPRIDGSLDDFREDWLVPPLMELDGQQAWGRVYATWDEGGLYLACAVEGKRQPLHCDPRHYRTSDNLRLCTDMRDTRDIKRATRFCRQLFFLPVGGGKDRNEAVAGAVDVPRAREPAPPVDPGAIRVASCVRAGGYTMTAHITAAGLAGFDPAEHRRIGFYYMLEDREHGQQFLTVGDDLNWWFDPSTWATAVLSDAAGG